MNRAAFIPLLLVGAVGTGCALLITGTYMILHIPLPFSIILSCVVMTAAVGMMAFRVRKDRPASDGPSYTFADAAPADAAPFTASSTPRLQLLPAGGMRGDDPGIKEDAPRAEDATRAAARRAEIQLEAITLFELPRTAREQEAA
jgi:hypothetical protein